MKRQEKADSKDKKSEVMNQKDIKERSIFDSAPFFYINLSSRF